MKTTIAVLGIVVLLVGVGLAAYGAADPISTTTSHTSSVNSVVVPQTSRVIDTAGLWTPGAYVFTKNEVVTATFTLTNYSSTEGPVFLYTQNLAQYIAWGACSPCKSPSQSNVTLPSSGTYTLTWTAPNNGSYYFTFDDEVYNSAASAQFNAIGSTPVTTQVTTLSQNTTFLYSGAGLLIVGALILSVGILTTGSKSTMMAPSKSSEGTKS